MAKDWVGGSASIYKTLGASNHTDTERQKEDYYATEPKATEWLCKLEQFVEKALSIIPEGKKVAMFLKLTFLEGKARRALFRSTPPHSCLGELFKAEMRHERRLRGFRKQRSSLRMVCVGEGV